MTSDAIRTQVQTAIQSLPQGSTCNFVLYGVDEGTTNERFNVSAKKAQAYLAKHMAYLDTFDVIVLTEPVMFLRAFLQDNHFWRVVVWAHVPLTHMHGETFPIKDYVRLLQSTSRSHLIHPHAMGRRASATRQHQARIERKTMLKSEMDVNWPELTLPKPYNANTRVMVVFASASLKWHALEVINCAPTSWKRAIAGQAPMLAVISTKCISHSATQFVTSVEMHTWPKFGSINAFDQDLAQAINNNGEEGMDTLERLRNEHRVWVHVPQDSDPYFAYAWLRNDPRNTFWVPSLVFLTKQFRFITRKKPNPKFHFKYPIPNGYEMVVANSMWYRKPLLGDRSRIRYFSSFRQLVEMVAATPTEGNQSQTTEGTL